MIAVDIFSGAGGFSSGAVSAGAQLIWAANHWRQAVDCHSENHPNVCHICQDMNTFPSVEIPDHDLLLASPSCKGFSPARGKHQKHHDKYRATAWIVVDVLEAKQPTFAVIENVPQMRKWILYQSWKHAIESLGYSISEKIVDAADLGVPQNRVRLFIVLTRSKTSFDLHIKKQPTKPIENVLDWKAGRWSRIYKAKRAAKTIARIKNAVKAGLGPRFLCPYYGAARSGRSIKRPIGTLTTKPRYALVDMDLERMRMLSIPEAKAAMGFDQSYSLPRNSGISNMLLGNAVCPPVAHEIVSQVISRG